jgi:hypothetical protein
MGDRSAVDAVRARLADPHHVVRLLGLDVAPRTSTRARTIFVSCPWHSERTASCALTTGDRGLVARCHGCSAGGDVLALVAAVEGLDVRADFSRVLARAAELANVTASPAPTVHQHQHQRTRVDEPAYDAARFDLLARCILDVGRLDGRPGSLDVEAYLGERGLLVGAIVDGWGALPPVRSQRAFLDAVIDAAEERAAIEGADGGAPSLAGRFTLADLEAAGLVGGEAFLHPAARVLIPWKDPAGRVVNIQRRRVDDGTPKYVGAKGRPFPWPYGAEHIRGTALDVPIAFAEGAADVLALRDILADRGELALVLGLPGLAGWRSSWAPLARGRVAAVALDADPAGERDVMKIARDLIDAGAREIERWKPPAKDWNAATMGGAA